MIEFSVKGFLATLLFLCPLVGAGSFYFVADENRPLKLLVPFISLTLFLIFLGSLLFLGPFQWPLHLEYEKSSFLFAGLIDDRTIKVTGVFVSTLLLCGVFHWTVLEQKFLDTKKYAAYLSLLLFFFLILVTAQSFFSFLLSLGGVSVVGYLVKTFMYEDVDSNRASFTHQILEFITLFFCMAGGFFSLKKPGLSGSSNIYYCLPVFFLILQKVDVVGFNFWRKEKKDVLSNFYFIFQKNFFLLTPIILYTFTHLMRFPEALKFGFMALGVFHLISACSHVFEGIEIRGVVESLYRFFGAIFLICIVRVKSVESAVLFLLFSSCVLVLLFLTNSAIEYFFLRDDSNQLVSRKTFFLGFSFALSLVAFIGGTLFFSATYLDEVNALMQCVYVFVFSLFSIVFFLRWGSLLGEAAWARFWVLRKKEALCLSCLSLGAIVLLFLFFEIGAFFPNRRPYKLYLLCYFCAFSLVPFSFGLFLKGERLYRVFHNIFFIMATQKAEDSFSAAYEYIFIVPFKYLSEFFSRRVDAFLFEENFFNGAVGFLSSANKIIWPGLKRGFSHQMVSIVLIIAFLAFISQVL